jgi:hypothetical protein
MSNLSGRFSCQEKIVASAEDIILIGTIVSV